eukprot:3240-Heterococcus_DN1.PRE.1
MQQQQQQQQQFITPTAATASAAAIATAAAAATTADSDAGLSWIHAIAAAHPTPAATPVVAAAALTSPEQLQPPGAFWGQSPLSASPFAGAAAAAATSFGLSVGGLVITPTADTAL